MLGATEEFRLDGYRVEVRRRGDRTKLYSRNGNDLTRQFPAVAKALEYLLPARSLTEKWRRSIPAAHDIVVRAQISRYLAVGA